MFLSINNLFCGNKVSFIKISVRKFDINITKIFLGHEKAKKKKVWKIFKPFVEGIFKP